MEKCQKHGGQGVLEQANLKLVSPGRGGRVHNDRIRIWCDGSVFVDESEKRTLRAHCMDQNRSENLRGGRGAQLARPHYPTNQGLLRSRETRIGLGVSDLKQMIEERLASIVYGGWATQQVRLIGMI